MTDGQHDAPARDLPGLPAAPAERWLRSALPSFFTGGRSEGGSLGFGPAESGASASGSSESGSSASGSWRAEVITGGLSNITYRLWLPGGTVILRRPPLGHALPRAHDMGREYRVLSALFPTHVPVPEPLALCADPSVLGVTFYVMREVPGVVMRRPGDTDVLSRASRGRLAESLISTLAGLHACDPDEIGLGDFGRRSGYCARQIHTWAGQWERSKTRDLPDMKRLLWRLSDRAPEDSACTVVHGDFRLDNTIVSFSNDAEPGADGVSDRGVFEGGVPDGGIIEDGMPRVAAVLDWELSTLGDPLADLATMLSYWHDQGDAERARIPVSVGLTDKAGFPTARSLASAYASRTGRDLGNLPFYMALALMKLAVICEGVHARYLGGQTVGEGYDRVGPAVPLLVARGLRALNDPALRE